MSGRAVTRLGWTRLAAISGLTYLLAAVTGCAGWKQKVQPATVTATREDRAAEAVRTFEEHRDAAQLGAALDRWNRVEKPQIENVTIDPRPRVDPILLDRAFTFSPASVLNLADLRTTEARINALGIFPRYEFALSGRPDEKGEEGGKFDLVFRSTERNGWGSSTVAGLVSLLRGLPYLTVYPEWYNLKRSATNLQSLVRWDAEKRRLFATLSGPLGRDPKWRYRVYVDGRKENWDISRTFFGNGFGSAAPVSDLKLEKLEAGAEIHSIESGRWSWKTRCGSWGRRH